MSHRRNQYVIDVQGGEEWDVAGFLSFLFNQMKMSPTEISVAFVSKAQMHSLNKQYLKVDEPTDVLSFVQSPPQILGDIVLNKEIVAMHAKSNAISVELEMKRCIIHGILHLSGMTHSKEWNSPMVVYQEELLKSVEPYPLEKLE